MNKINQNLLSEIRERLDRDPLLSVQIRLNSALNIFSLLTFLFFFSLLSVAGSFLLPWSGYAYYTLIPLLIFSVFHVLYRSTLYIRTIYSFASRVPRSVIFSVYLVLACTFFGFYLHNVLHLF